VVDQPLELVELGSRKALVLEQVCDQATDVAAEDPIEKVAGSRALDLVFLELGKKEEGSPRGLVPHRPLSLELAQERLHRAMRHGLGCAQGIRDLTSTGAIEVPQNLHDPELHPSQLSLAHPQILRRRRSSTSVNLSK